MKARRALHFVFKVGDRAETARFYRELLRMRVLRHEEFEEGCKATCNGYVSFSSEEEFFIKAFLKSTPFLLGTSKTGALGS